MANGTSWLIVGTIPDESIPLLYGQTSFARGELTVGSTALPLARGTAALLAAAALAITELGGEPPRAFLVGDTGAGRKSRLLYQSLVEQKERLAGPGITFHYSYPDVDWHNRILLAIDSLARRPLLVADAGFMYVAKMSGYASSYDLFTPDLGELAFLADPLAPHPFYTRGFLLAQSDDLSKLVRSAYEGENAASWLIVKGKKDWVVHRGHTEAEIDSPDVPAMEAIGGTGDLVTGLATAFLACGLPMGDACIRACRLAREVGYLAGPTPATQIDQLLPFVPAALRKKT